MLSGRIHACRMCAQGMINRRKDEQIKACLGGVYNIDERLTRIAGAARGNPARAHRAVKERSLSTERNSSIQARPKSTNSKDFAANASPRFAKSQGLSAQFFF